MYHTGWSKTSHTKLNDIVDKISSLLGERKGDLKRWTSDDANEDGLDLLCYRPFSDNRVGIPIYLMQCASGHNWKSKLHTPCLSTWTKIIIFAATPRKAFSIPFAIEDKVFPRFCGLVDGMLLDRYRLLFPLGKKANWLSAKLKPRIIKWNRPRILSISKC